MGRAGILVILIISFVGLPSLIPSLASSQFNNSFTGKSSSAQPTVWGLVAQNQKGLGAGPTSDLWDSTSPGPSESPSYSEVDDEGTENEKTPSGAVGAKGKASGNSEGWVHLTSQTASLREVLSKKLTGIPLASDQLSDQAQKYIRFRKDLLNPEEKAQFFVECLTKPQQNFFCEFFGRKIFEQTFVDSKKMAMEVGIGKAGNIIEPEELTRGIFKNDPSVFQGASRRSIQRSFRNINEWDSLKAFTNQVLSHNSCWGESLHFQLALKIEDFFPDGEVREKAIKLYEKAIECLKGDPETQSLARFRIALLQIWNDQCTQALPHLRDLAATDDGLFQSRGYYWSAYCAYRANDKLLFQVFRNQLMKVNPLGYHTLSLNQGKIFAVQSLVHRPQIPYILFRSELKPEVNRFVEAVEILLELGETKLARETLQWSKERLISTEPGFRLYAAVLADRMGAEILKFQILAEVFKEEPGFIAADTLRMFYPLKEFSTLWQYRERVDPYLIAALIRQESGFMPNIRSSAGALGLMQLMPGTAFRLAKVSRRHLLNPRTNIKLGVQYFDSLLRQFNNDVELSLAAYNAGPHRLEEWKRRYPVDNRMLFLDLIPFSETRNYVALIGRNYYWYLSLYAPEALHLDKQMGRFLASQFTKPMGFSAFSAF